VEKYCRVGHATDDNMAHALYVLDTSDYKDKHIIFDFQCSWVRAS